ncbi:hypothetical protein [Nocardioides sp.]|uniref:hypothetical protein n=1 Tax=Nocardioides sp. TaxID=35761 RepID=UPI003566074A
MSAQPRRRRVKYADITATLALVIAMSTGGAFAANKIGSNQIAKNAVKSSHIKDGQVKTKDLKKNAVKSAQVKDGSLKSADIADGSLGSSDLASQVDGVAMAGVTINSSGTVKQSFNRMGGDITVTHPSTGNYLVTIPGTTFSGFTSVLSSVNGSFSDYCFVNQGAGSVVTLACRDFSNVAVDTTINFVLFRDLSTVPTRPGPVSKGSADGS